MVEANNQNLDVKLSLDVAAQGKSPVVKRVMASNFDTLLTTAKNLATKNGVNPEEINLRYHDGDNWVVVEDDDDVQLAFTLARSSNGKVIFTIKSTKAVASAPEISAFATTATTMEVDEEVQPAAAATGHKNKKPKKEKGIPRKAIKNLINNELNKQAQDVFQKLMKSGDLGDVDMTPEEAEAVHEGVECDGCGMNPIRGLRYKCTIRKNYDVCATCEERQGHEHAFVKIRQPGGAPDVMIVVADEEDKKEAENEESKGQHQNQDPMQFIGEMMGAFRGGRGGRGGFGGRGGRGGCGRGGGPFKHMINDFMQKFSSGECKNWTPEQWQEKVAEGCQKFQNHWGQHGPGHHGHGQGHGHGHWNNFEGKQGWKEARAVCQRKPEDPIEIVPGMTEIVEIEVLNDTYWPWKPNCTLTLADEQPSFELPIDVFSVPVEQEVKGKATATFSVPLTAAHHMVADDEKVYEVALTFRGPRGQSFGATIPLKIKCVLNKQRIMTDLDIYKLAIKLHEQLQLGSLDDCIRVVRENNGDEAESIKGLQRNN